MACLFERLLLSYARGFPLRRGKLRVINALWRRVIRNNGTRRIATLKYGAFRIPCDLDQILQRQFYFFGTYLVEEDILRCWMNVAVGAKVIFDVGANAGIYSLAALAAQPDATVHAFEATPEIAARLREGADLNNLHHLYVHETGVSNRNGYAALIRCRGELGANEGMNFISANANDTSERVETVSLDRFCQKHSIGYIDLLKLDVQGHEYSVLQGAEQLIRSGQPKTIFMELNWAASHSKNCPAFSSIKLLDGAGYQFSKPGKNLEWRRAGDWLRHLSDVVACHLNP